MCSTWGVLHLLILRYLVPMTEVEPHVAHHVRYLERHHGDGVFLASGQTVPVDEGGAIVARGVDRERIERITADDPFVRAGVAGYEIVTITAGRVHPDLSGLLTAGSIDGAVGGG